jgi:hypothetical protein
MHRDGQPIFGRSLCPLLSSYAWARRRTMASPLRERYLHSDLQPTLVNGERRLSARSSSRIIAAELS